MRVAVPQRADAGLDNRLGSREIRLADFHVHDVAPRRGGGLGVTHHFHDVKRGDVSHAGGGAKTVGHHVMRRAANAGRQSSSGR